MMKRLKLDQMPLWVHGYTWGLTLLTFLMALLVFLLYKDTALWEAWTPADELIQPEYGERIYRDSIFRTRINTWSNLIYCLFGYYVTVISIWDWKRGFQLKDGYLVATPALGFLLGLAGVYLGFGSGMFHASLTRVGQQLDVGAMYSLMIGLTCIAVGSWLPKLEIIWLRKVIPSWPFLVGLMLFGSVYFTYYKWEYNFTEISGYLTAVLMVFALVSLVQPGKYLQFGWFVAGLTSIILASRIRDLDIARSFTGPDSLLQGHAVWHFLSCLLFVFLYLYFRSERRN
ncbi:hypothetical protein [Algoriphagus namhaensis]